MLRFMKIDHFVFCFFFDLEIKMGNPLVSRTLSTISIGNVLNQTNTHKDKFDSDRSKKTFYNEWRFNKLLLCNALYERKLL